MIEKLYYVYDSNGWSELVVQAKDKRTAISKALTDINKTYENVIKDDLEAKLLKFNKDGVCYIGS